MRVQGLLKVMVVGEGLLSAARFALRVVACGNALSLALEMLYIQAAKKGE